MLIPGKRDYKWLAAEETCNWKEKSRIMTSPRKAVTENAYASQTRLTISVRVRFTNTKDPQYDIDQTFSGYKDFSSDRMLTDVQDELIQQITDELVDQIFNATVANW